MRPVMKDERLQNYLSTNQIKWQFNLSHAPWWGGQFERMVGLVKSALNKTIRNGAELEGVAGSVTICRDNAT